MALALGASRFFARRSHDFVPIARAVRRPSKSDSPHTLDAFTYVCQGWEELLPAKGGGGGGDEHGKDI